MALCEWEKHVTKEGAGEEWPRTAWCGAALWRWAWAFFDTQHAQIAESKGSRLQMCPECKKAIMQAQEPRPTLVPED